MSKLNHQSIAELFTRYLENRCTPEEIRELLIHFGTEQDEQELRTLINAELGVGHIHAEEASVDQAILQVKAALLKQIKKSVRDRPVKRLRFPYWLRLSAIWLVLSGLAALFINYYWSDLNAFFHPVNLISTVTKTGERKIITLSDGTKIWLSPSSTLQYPGQLVGNLREVKLEGEAFFEVAKDKRHPFVIHSTGMDTRVVGTSFNIQSFKAQKNYKVTVVTGIVKVAALNGAGGKKKEVTLKPDQQALLDKGAGVLTSYNDPNAKEMLKRRDGILAYDDSPVQEVVADLERYYRLPVKIESKSASCRCYGEFNTNRPIYVVLEQLAAAINAKVIFRDNEYVLKGGCENDQQR